MSKFLETNLQVYKKWIISNSESLSDFEQALKWTSYFIAGRINNSNILSELIFSLSNLLVLTNDRIILKELTKNDPVVKKKSVEYLQLCLTTLEYCEVFIELSFKKMFGEKGKFLVITIIQVIKCIGRLIMFLKHKQISTSPAFQPVDRKKLQFGQNGELLNQNNDNITSSNITFKLKRSGKVIRKVANAPGLYNRDFKEISSSSDNSQVQVLDRMKVTHAELIYIFKPLIHLGSVRLFGYNSWKSFSTSLFLDFLSLKLFSNNKVHLSTEDKRELSRRCVGVIMYVFKSPFYDKFSKNKIEAFLRAFSKCLPCFNPIMNPLMDYIPYWQSTYFYLWSN